MNDAHTTSRNDKIESVPSDSAQINHIRNIRGKGARIRYVLRPPFFKNGWPKIRSQYLYIKLLSAH